MAIGGPAGEITERRSTMGLFGPPDVEKMKARRDINGLIKALGYEKNTYYSYRSAEALGEIGPRLVDVALRDRAVQALIAALTKGDDRDLKKSAADALGQFGDPRAVQPLIAAIEDKNLYMGVYSAMAAINAEGKIGDEFVAIAAINALGKIGEMHAVEPLNSALNDHRREVRSAAAEALVKIKTHDSEWLKSAIKGGNIELRQAAAEALAAIGDDDAVAYLIYFAKAGSDFYERNTARLALVKIYKQGKLSERQKQHILAQRDSLMRVHKDSVAHIDLKPIPHEDEYHCGEFHGDNESRTSHQDHPGTHSDGYQNTGVDFPL
jgi:HEAT repeat protein